MRLGSGLIAGGSLGPWHAGGRGNTVVCVIYGLGIMLGQVWANEGPRPMVEPSSCAVAAAIDVCRLCGRVPDADILQALVDKHPGPEASMLDVVEAAAEIGVELRGVRAAWSDLLQCPGPKVIHLARPAHFLVLVCAGGEWAQLMNAGAVAVVPVGEVEREYSGVALLVTPTTDDTGPKAAIAETCHFFGSARLGDVVSWRFPIRNVGDADLELVAAPQACARAPVRLSPPVLGPGEAGYAEIEVPMLRSGRQVHTAELLTTDPLRPVVLLSLHGVVPTPVRASPGALRMRLPRGTPVTRALEVTGPAEMDITEVDTEHGLLLTQLGEPTVDEDEKKSWTLIASLKDESFVGEIEDTIRTKTTHPERPLITIPVTGVIRGDLRVDPPSAFFGFVKPGAEAKQEVVIQSRSGAEFTVTGVECRTAGVTVGAPQERQDGAWAIPVSVDTAKAGVVDAAITVTTGVKGEETLTIPVYAHVTEGE